MYVQKQYCKFPNIPGIKIIKCKCGMFSNSETTYRLLFCSLSGPEATMYVSSGGPRCVHSGCASERCSYCAGCVSGGIWLTGGWWSVKIELLSLFNTMAASHHHFKDYVSKLSWQLMNNTVDLRSKRYRIYRVGMQ